MTLAQQLGNVGSEYERAKRWKEKGNKELFDKALDRFLELIDLTITDSRWQNHRLRELCRLREMVLDYLLNDQTQMTDFSSYFTQFGLAARRK